MGGDKPRVTFGCYEAVWVKILGEKDERPSRYPRVRRDGGIVSRFLRWQLAEDVLPLRSIVSGPGLYQAIHHLDDLERIENWLKEQGCEPEGEQE